MRKQNPHSQRSIALPLKTSPATFSKIIHKDLELEVVKKSRVHKLNAKHYLTEPPIADSYMKNTCPKKKWIFVVTFDEVWSDLSDCDKKRGIIY